MRLANFGVVAVSLGVLALVLPAPASACGFKTLGVNANISYSGAHTAGVVGTVAIFGDTHVNRRLELGLRAAGHKVHRVASLDEARSADVVLTSVAGLEDLESGLQGSKARVVVVMGADETSDRKVEYAVRMNDRATTQLVLVEKAIREAKGV